MFKRARLPLTSDQLDLLYSFSKASGLQELSEILHKDSSVVSRSLQQLAETAPVLEKVGRKWQISALGHSVIEKYQSFQGELETLLKTKSPDVNLKISDSLLVVINAQKFFEKNPEAIAAFEKIQALLTFAREKNLATIFVRHISQNEKSAFHKSAKSSELIDSLNVLKTEKIYDKPHASVWSSAEFKNDIDAANYKNIILVGLTGNDCIEVSSRDLNLNGFSVFVVSDATSSMQLIGPNGELHSATRVHQLALANIHAFSANVFTLAELLSIFI